MTKGLHRESVKGKTERIVTDLCPTRIPRAIFCVPLVEVNHVPRIGHAEIVNLGQKINGRGVYPDGIHIRRKDKKSVASSDSGSSLPKPNLTIQVTPKTFVARNKDGDQTLQRNSPTPQDFKPVDNIIPDTPRTNALRTEFSSQIDILGLKNQMGNHHKDFAASSSMEVQFQLQGLLGL